MTADTKLVNRILDILKPMGDIVTQEEPSGDLSLFNEGIKFCIIKGQDVYMMDKNFEYSKLMEYVMEDPSIILSGGESSFKKVGKKFG
jgi:hypothetical protein